MSATQRTPRPQCLNLKPGIGNRLVPVAPGYAPVGLRRNPSLLYLFQHQVYIEFAHSRSRKIGLAFKHCVALVPVGQIADRCQLVRLLIVQFVFTYCCADDPRTGRSLPIVDKPYTGYLCETAIFALLYNPAHAALQSLAQFGSGHLYENDLILEGQDRIHMAICNGPGWV